MTLEELDNIENDLRKMNKVLPEDYSTAKAFELANALRPFLRPRETADHLETLTLELEIQNGIRKTLDAQRESLVESLLLRIEDGKEMVRDKMIVSQCERIRAFDKIVKDRTFL